MTRKKVKLTYISNDSARKATFKKRKKGLIKKVSELSTLCGIDACAIIYSPYESQPEVWPPSQTDVNRVLSAFKRMPEMEQSKKMVNQEGFLRQRITKASDQLRKQRRENREKEVTQVMFQGLVGRSLDGLNMLDLNDLGWVIDQKSKEIEKRSDAARKAAAAAANYVQMNAPPPPPPAPATPPPYVVSAAPATRMMNNPQPQQQQQGGVLDVNNMDSFQRQQWLMELMNPQDNTMTMNNLGFEDDMILPFGDVNHNALWSSAFFN